MTSFLSWLIGQHEQQQQQTQPTTGGATTSPPQTTQERAAAATQIGEAVLNLGRAATASGGSIALTSPNLNVRATSLMPSDLLNTLAPSNNGSSSSGSSSSAAVLSVPAASGVDGDASVPTRPVEVVLPTSVLSESLGIVNSSLPLAMCLSTSAVNLYGPIIVEDDEEESGIQIEATSPLVGFSLLQGGKELKVNNVDERINVSLPLTKQPSEGFEFGCRWWDVSNSQWASDGCLTVYDPLGAVTCSCTHLTSFIVFEFPVTMEEFTEDVSEALSINPLTLRSWQCLATPQPMDILSNGLWRLSSSSGNASIGVNGTTTLYTLPGWNAIPGVWVVNGALLLLAIVSLSYAAHRDARELDWVEGLVRGKIRDERRRGFFRSGKGGGRMSSVLLDRMSIRRQSMTGRWRETIAETSEKAAKAKTTTRRSSSSFLDPWPGNPKTPLPQKAKANGKDGNHGITPRIDMSHDNLPVPYETTHVAALSKRSSSGNSIVGGESLQIHPSDDGDANEPSLRVDDLENFDDGDDEVLKAIERYKGDQANGGYVTDPYTGVSPPAAADNGVPPISAPATSSSRWGAKHYTPSKKRGALNKALSEDSGLALDDAGYEAELQGEAEWEDVHALRRSIEAKRPMLGKTRSHSPNALSMAIQRSGSKLNSLVSHLRRGGSSSKSLKREVDAGRDLRSQLLPWQRERAQRHWMIARRQVEHVTLARRWHKSVNRAYKRLWLSFKESHTLAAGVFFRGASGTLLPRLTRAQTVQILLNSLAFELVVLCMLLSSPSDGPLVINPVKIIASGSLAALICIPGTVLSAGLFAPRQLARGLGKIFCCVAKSPWRLLKCCGRLWCRILCCRGGSSRRVTPVLAGERGSTPRGVDDEDEDEGEEDSRTAEGDRLPLTPSRRRYDYTSLDTYMVQMSFRRSFRKREWRHVLPVACGWLANWALMIGLMSIVSAYGCEFYASLAEGKHSEAFLLSWGWSIIQRFVVNEPMLILAQKGVPMLFASVACEHFLSESMVACLGLIVESFVVLLRSLRAASSS